MLFLQIFALIAFVFFVLAYAYLISVPSMLLGDTGMMGFTRYVKVLSQSYNTLLMLWGFKAELYLNTTNPSSEIEIKNKMKENPHLIDIIYCNHISTIDFLLLMSYLQYFEIDGFNFVLKKGITYYPGFGVIMYTNPDIKLDRNWETDQKNIVKQIQNIKMTDKKQVLLIFPEGTRFTAEKMIEAQQFAFDNGYTPYQYTMFPKTKGTWLLINSLHNAKKLGRVWDATLIIPKFIRKSAYLSDIMGKALGPVYADFKEIVLPNNFQDMMEFKNWFLDNWKEKDNMIKNYNNNKYKHLEFKDKHYNHIAYIMMICTFGFIMLSTDFSLYLFLFSVILAYVFIIFKL